jgi:hypothetical protein
VHGVTIGRVLTDNAKNYRDSHDWAAVCTALQIKRRYIKPRCPWTNCEGAHALLAVWLLDQPARTWCPVAELSAARRSAFVAAPTEPRDLIGARPEVPSLLPSLLTDLERT